MLIMKENINTLDYDLLMQDKYNAFKILKILRWQGYNAKADEKEEKARFSARKQEAIQLLKKYNYSKEEIDDLLIATGFSQSKIAKLPTTAKEKREMKKRSKQAKEHIDFLHEHPHSKSWVCLAQIDYSMAEDGWAQYHYWNNDVANKVIDILYKNTSTYISVNEFRAPIRNALSIRYMTSFYADIDAHVDGVEVDIKAIKRYLKQKYKEGKLPPHSRITFTGRGVQIYWKLELVPDCLYWMWCNVQGYIVKELKDIKEHIEHHEVDLSCIDVARVLRVEGSVNPKADNMVCTCIEKNDNVYRMTDILKEYFRDKIRVSRKKAEHDSVTDSAGRVLVLTDAQEQKACIMRQRRIRDLKTLLGLRKYQIQEGHREEFLWIYAWTWVANITTENMIYKELSSVNEMFHDPLLAKEVREVASKVFKGWSSRKLKNTAKENSWSRLTGRYCFRNTTIIDKLAITPAEREHFETIFINKEEAERIAYSKRRNEKKRKARIDEKTGLKPKELELHLLFEKIVALKQAKTKNKEIAESLEIPLKTLERHITKLKKDGRL